MTALYFDLATMTCLRAALRRQDGALGAALMRLEVSFMTTAGVL